MAGRGNGALDARALAFQLGLSPWNEVFLATALRDDRYRQQRGAAPSFEGLPGHGWPTFVDADRIQEWARLSAAMRALVARTGVSLIPSRAPEIADLFRYPPERAALIARLLADPTRGAAFAARGDFLLSAAGLKCCEVDFGDVGLWHLDSVNRMFRHSPIVREFISSQGVRVRERNPFRTVVHELVKLVGRRGPVRECNFAIVVPDDTPADAFEAGRLQAGLASFLYQGTLRSLGLDGELVLARAGSLGRRDDHAAVGDKRIHVVMTQAPTLAAEAEVWTGSPLLDLVGRGHVCTLNGPDCSAISNKIVLALLSEAADADRLDADDTALVRSALPWTRRVRAVRVRRGAREHWLPDLLLAARDDLVLKPGEGFASTGVVIGRNTSPADWERAVTGALEHGNWVAQEAVGGTPMWLLGQDDALAPHSVNISVVLCGAEYAGVFLRLMPIASPDEVPTIGYSLGAVTGGIIEVERA